MSPQKFKVLFTIFAVVWVGGWGWLAYRYPEFFAKVNARFGFKQFTGPRYITFIRRMGLVEMTLAGLTALGTIIEIALGLNW